ncbi:hypothetical protein GCM10009674_24740 [Nesterenkonia xinjiangensis]
MTLIERRATAAGLVGLSVFQSGLALGAPWGRASYGGAHAGALPAHLRAVSAGSTVAYAGLAWAVVSPRTPVRLRRRILTGVAGVMSLAVVVNGLSPSRPERATWTPVSAGLALSAWRARRGTTH